MNAERPRHTVPVVVVDWRMRQGIIVEVSATDRARLEAVVADRNSPQKHVWRARIVLLTADGHGRVEIMRQTGVSKVAVWRWQERFMTAGVAGLLRDKTRSGDLDDGASTIDTGLAELDAAHRRARIALLEEGVKVDILRHDAIAVVRRIEMLVATDHPTERPAWLSGFRQRYDAFSEEGEAKGINFSLSIAIELARRMVATAHDSTERGTAANLLGNALVRLGERESGTEKLEQAVVAYRAALEEWTRERVPLDWATTQNNLGNALRSLGERHEPCGSSHRGLSGRP